MIQEHEDDHDLATALLTLGQHELDEGDAATALIHLKSAEAIFEGLGDEICEADTLSLQRWVYQALERPADARRVTQRSLYLTTAKAGMAEMVGLWDAGRQAADDGNLLMARVYRLAAEALAWRLVDEEAEGAEEGLEFAQGEADAHLTDHIRRSVDDE
jgi:hypothetical protein